jgi:hypothetical protein
MDVNLPGIDGLEATRRLLGRDYPPVMLLLSTYGLVAVGYVFIVVIVGLAVGGGTGWAAGRRPWV